MRGWEDAPFNTVYAISTKPEGRRARNVRGRQLGPHRPRADHPRLPDGIADHRDGLGQGLEPATGRHCVELTCVECHNPHGNGNYRILRPVPGIEADPLGQPEPVDVKATYANADTIVTDGQHGLVVNDLVTLTGVADLANRHVLRHDGHQRLHLQGARRPSAAPRLARDRHGRPPARSSGRASRSPMSPTIRTAIRTTASRTRPRTTPSSRPRAARASTRRTSCTPATSSPLATSSRVASTTTSPPSRSTTRSPRVGPRTSRRRRRPRPRRRRPRHHRRHAGRRVGRDVHRRGCRAPRAPSTTNSRSSAQTITAGATAGTVVRNGIPGDYTATGGDYFRRIVPWDASHRQPATASTPTFASTNSAYCGTANDAPNGRPGAITQSGPSTLVGQQAFLDQISTWCSQCHTRYYSNTNENVEAWTRRSRPSRTERLAR